MSKQTYFQNESENAKRLQEFIDREPPGPSRETLALLRMKMCEAVERDQSPLVMDFAKTIANLEKTADTRAIHAKEWRKPSDLALFREALLEAIVNEFASAPTSREKLSTVCSRIVSELGVDRASLDEIIADELSECLDWEDRVERLAFDFEAKLKAIEANPHVRFTTAEKPRQGGAVA